MKTLILAVLTLFLPLTSFAKVELTIEKPYIYTPLKGAPATAGYGIFKNYSSESIKVSIEKADGFKAVEMHESLMKDGRMAMQKIDSITIEKNKEFVLKPGGHHIMLFDATRDFKDGAKTTITFKVNGKSTAYEFAVEPRVKSEDKGHHHHH